MTDTMRCYGAHLATYQLSSTQVGLTDHVIRYRLHPIKLCLATSFRAPLGVAHCTITEEPVMVQ